MRSREIMDAVEHGQSFTVTRDGHDIGQLIPIRRQRTFVAREDFVAMSKGIGYVDPDRFRADLDSVANPYFSDPYDV